MAGVLLIELEEGQNVMRHNNRVKKMVVYSSSLNIFLFLLFLTYTNFALGAQTNLTIKGHITNIPPDSSKLVHLYSYYGSEFSEDASASVNEQGSFKLEIKGNLQQGLFRIGIDKKYAASIVLSGEKDVSIKADYEKLKEDRITVIDSRENEAYRALLSEWSQMGSKMVNLNIEKSQVSVVDPFYVQKIKDLEDKMRLVIEERNVHLLYIRECYLDTFMEEALVNLSHLP